MRIGLMVAAIVLLGGCNAKAPAPPANDTKAAPAATTAPAPAKEIAAATGTSDLKPWLIGSWSFEDSCTTDFIVHYNADGTLDNSGNIGRWSITGDKITETVTQKPDENGEGTVKVDPPEVITYTVARGDQTHGTVSYQGRNVPILRC